MALYTISYGPKSGVRVPFGKIISDTDDHAVAQAQGIQAVRAENSGYALTKSFLTNDTPVPETGNGWKVCFVFKTALGINVRICIEHADNTADVSALGALLMAKCTDPDGNALTSLVKIDWSKEVYV